MLQPETCHEFYSAGNESMIYQVFLNAECNTSYVELKDFMQTNATYYAWAYLLISLISPSQPRFAAE